MLPQLTVYPALRVHRGFGVASGDLFKETWVTEEMSKWARVLLVQSQGSEFKSTALMYKAI